MDDIVVCTMEKDNHLLLTLLTPQKWPITERAGGGSGKNVDYISCGQNELKPFLNLGSSFVWVFPFSCVNETPFSGYLLNIISTFYLCFNAL